MLDMKFRHSQKCTHEVALMGGIFRANSVHESLYLRNNGFPYAEFLALFVSRIFHPCSIVAHLLHLYVPHFQRSLIFQQQLTLTFDLDSFQYFTGRAACRVFLLP